MSTATSRTVEDNSNSDDVISFLSIDDEAEDKEDVALLMGPLNYLLQVPGKNFRKKFIRAINFWLKVPEDKVVKIEEIVQVAHNSSLLMDDIEDSSGIRRGNPAAHQIYGVPSTVNTVSFIFFEELRKMVNFAKEGSDEAYSSRRSRVEGIVEIFTDLGMEAHRGQGMEMYWRDSFTCPSEEEYKRMAVRKTGSFLSLAVRLLLLFSPSHSTDDGDKQKQERKDLSDLANLLGLYFQVRDDYINLCLDEYAKTKGFAEDLTEGKFSFPIIHAIRKTKYGEEIIQILRQRTVDVEVKKYCVSLLRKGGSLDYTKTVLEDLDRQARKTIEDLGGNKDLAGILDGLRDWDGK